MNFFLVDILISKDKEVDLNIKKQILIQGLNLINKELKKSDLPEEIKIGAVLREENIIIPRSSFVFQKDDKVVFLAKRDQLPTVENMFRISSV